MDENAGLNNNSYMPLTQEQTLDCVPKINKGVIKSKMNILIDGYKVDNDTYYNQFNFSDRIGSTDYLPAVIDASYGTNISKVASSVSSNHYFVNDNTYAFDNNEIVPGYNSIVYHINQNINQGSSIDLPFIYYAEMKYEVMVNGKVVNYSRSKRSIFELDNLPKTNRLNISITNLPSML